MPTVEIQQFQEIVVHRLVSAGKIKPAELQRYRVGSIAYRNDLGLVYLGIRVPNAKPGEPKVVQYWNRITRDLGFRDLSHAVYLSRRDSENILIEIRAECPDLYRQIINH